MPTSSAEMTESMSVSGEILGFMQVSRLLFECVLLISYVG
jgi:hypothetical protein